VARTAEGQRLTSKHRAQQLAVRAGTLRDLLVMWRTVDATNLKGTIDAFVRAAVLITLTGNQDSAAAARRYYPLFRRAERVPGSAPSAQPAAPLPPDRTAAMIRGAALAGIVQARQAGKSIDQAQRIGFARTAGEVAKLVLTGGRMALLTVVERDAQALGWQRVTSSDDPCPFCRMLVSRGPVYKSGESGDFETHGSCGCAVELVYDRDSDRLRQAETYRAEFDTAQRWAAADPANAGRPGSDNPGLNSYRRWLAAGSPPVG
jgi:hypothetical protein